MDDPELEAIKAKRLAELQSTPSSVETIGTAASPISRSPVSDSPASTESPIPSKGKTPQAPAAKVVPKTAPNGAPKTKDGSAKEVAHEHAKEEFLETIEGVLGMGSQRSESESSEAAHYQPIDLIRIMIPVMLCMLFVILMTILVTDPDQEKTRKKPFMALTPFDDVTKTDIGTKAWETAANVGILIAVIVVMTFLLVGLYLCYCYKCLLVLMAIPVIVVNLVFSWAYLNKVLKAMNVPFDHVTAAFISFNYGTIGILAILGRTPKLLQQFYLLYLCGVMASLYLSYMPDWTVWGFLAALAIWDLIAVLTPCGPLRILVETVQSRDHDFIPAMIYTTVAYLMADKKTEKKGKKGAKQKPKRKSDAKKGDAKKAKEGSDEAEEKKEKRRLRLGLGDFVFYSLLIGKATYMSVKHLYVVDWNTVMACFISIIVGLLATIILLVIRKKALPALPISIALGLTFYFSSYYVISPFCNLMSAHQVFL